MPDNKSDKTANPASVPASVRSPQSSLYTPSTKPKPKPSSLPEPVIRVRRILEYVGPKSWVARSLQESKIQPGKPAFTDRIGVIAEVGTVEFKVDREFVRLSYLAQCNHATPKRSQRSQRSSHSEKGRE